MIFERESHMNWKSLLLKPAAALAVVMFATASWAAGLSDEQEGGTSKLYCIKQDEENLELHLSQRSGGYTPESGEECFEQWYSPEGGTSAYTFIERAFTGDFPPETILLTSDIDFGGYNEETEACNEQFHPFDFDVSGDVSLESPSGYYYTISGLCYITASGTASFGGSVITYITGVRFKDLRLESTRFAGLFGSDNEFAEVTNVYVENAFVRAPVAGLFASRISELSVHEFSGYSITVNSIPQMDLSDVRPDTLSVSLGGLAGRARRVDVSGADIIYLYVINNIEGENDFSYSVSRLETYIGGIVALSSYVNISRVNIDSSVLSDKSDAQQVQSYLGGRVGAVLEYDEFRVNSTYTYADVSCSKDTAFYKAGYIVGYLNFGSESPSSDFNVVSNYHYTESSLDRAVGMVGIAECVYATSNGNRMCGDMLNRWGDLPIILDQDTDEPLFSVSRIAYGNFRSANEEANIGQTAGFDSEAYTFSDGNSVGFSVGYLDNSNMQKQAFADALNNYDLSYGAYMGMWNFDDDHRTPYMYVQTLAKSPSGGNDFSMNWVTFRLDCIESGCLTEDEVAALVQFSQYRIGSYEYEFPTDEFGAITNQDWLDFAEELQRSNSERDAVYWDKGDSYKEFAVNNKYSLSCTYTLTIGEAPQNSADEPKAYVFFGTGVDYGNSTVGVFSYTGWSVDDRGEEVDNGEYSGESDPVVMQSGPLMRVVASDIVMADGSRFKGWKVRAAMWSPDGYDVLRNKAFAGIDIPVDDEGYFNLYDRLDTIEKIYVRAVLGECYELTEEEHTVSMDSLLKLSKICSQKFDDSEMAFDSNFVIALAVYPVGFEAENELEDEGSGSTKPGTNTKYPALFLSGNAIQLAVKTDKFVQDEELPFVSVMLEYPDGETKDTLIEFPNGGWPEMITWEQFPLGPGQYQLKAKVFDGKNLEERKWKFVVNAQIAESGNGEWHMVSLWNVDFDSYVWNDDAVFYWWDEFAYFGKYWQYKELSKKDSPELGRGYWYNSLEGRALKLKDTVYTEAMAWHLDSVNTGWNLVSNPYGWFVDIGAESNEFGDEWYDKQIKWLEEEASNREEVDEEWLREEREWIEEERRMHQPAVEFKRWNSVKGEYEDVKTLAPYEAVWAKVNRGQEMDWELQPVPAFVATVNEDGDTVMVRSLNKKGVLAKAAGKGGWALQLVLSDAKGKMDSWNMVGAGKVAWSSEEPPAGMGDHVNLSIMDAGRRLAKSVKEENGDAEYEWNVELTATSDRVGSLKLVGIDGIRASGLRVFLTVDGNTVELEDGSGVQVRLSATPKVANIRVAKSARPVLAQNLQGLFARDAGNALQVGFDAGEGLAGAKARVDLVDMQGKVVKSMNFKAEGGRNEVSLEKPKGGLYIVRAVAGSKVATQKVLLK